MQDKSLACRECGGTFIFTVGEQQFFASRGLTNAPTRCPECRAARKASRGGEVQGGAPERTMFPAVCASCGRSTQVPFQPRADRPVYCANCFSAQRTASGPRERRLEPVPVASRPSPRWEDAVAAAPAPAPEPDWDARRGGNRRERGANRRYERNWDEESDDGSGRSRRDRW